MRTVFQELLKWKVSASAIMVTSIHLTVFRSMLKRYF